MPVTGSTNGRTPIGLTPAVRPRSRKRQIELTAEQLAAFEQFWTMYPRREGRKEALAEWQSLNPSPQLIVTMFAAIQAQSRAGAWWTDRRGKVAGYRDDFDAAQLAEIDRLVETTLDPLYGYTARATEGAA